MKLLVFGLGYTARAFVRRLGPEWTVVATSRGDSRVPLLPEGGLADVTHLLVSIPPDETGDPALDCHGEGLSALKSLRWLGYLSTTGVYGTRDGGWVDESAELRPSSPRAKRRAAAEQGWLGLGAHVFRLAGIYGPGRSAFDALRAGGAKRVDAGGLVFSRIHVDDIATVLLASIAKPRAGAIYNVCDDEPAAQEAVIAYAARLVGLTPPPLIPLAEADLTPMARSFYADNKRVSNALMKRELGIALAYPSYREGLAAVLANGG
ncbi:MAG TPA: SDR family oxidoreductase [Stellaceae bacterium]|nr:SDR family oxidoreductase [Stellaceae bacterium]